MSSGAFSSRALRIGAICSREAIIALKSSKKLPVVILGQAEDRHAPDMHRHFRRFQIQKRRVHRGQFLGVTHVFLPRQITRRLGGASGVQAVPGSRTSGQDCAFSGGAYAMANGPDRSNCLNSPSACASRSATAHNAAGVDAEPDMAGQMHLDILGGIGGAQQAGSPVHDAVGARIDRGGRHRQVAGDRLPKLGLSSTASPDSAS